MSCGGRDGNGDGRGRGLCDRGPYGVGKFLGGDGLETCGEWGWG